MKLSKRTWWISLLVAAVAALFFWTRRSDRSEQVDTDVAAADVGSTRTARSDAKPTPKVPRQSTLALLEAPKASVSGTVRVKGGGPLAGARVCAFQDDSRLETPREVPCVVTTADGRYRIEGLLGAEYDVTASAPRHITGRYVSKERHDPGLRLAAGQQRGDIDIVLRPGGVQVFGVVRDISGGEIAGAQVREGYPGGFGSPPTTAIADAEGKFSLWVEEGGARLRAQAEGYAEETQWGPAPGKFFELYLTPEAVVVGRVVDVATGDPIEGARVTAKGGHMVITKADGSFRMDGLSPGVYKPTAKADEGYGEAEASVHLGLGETSDEVLVQLHPAASVSGVVLVREGEETRPCEEGGASLHPIPDVGWMNNRASTTTEGRVEIHGVLPGRYRVSAHCRGFVHEDSYGEIEVGDDSIDGLVWETKTGSVIRGRVLAEADRLPSLRVDARAKASGREQMFWASSRDLGEDGSFELTGLLPATYEISLRGDGLPRQNEPLEVEVGEGEEVDGIELEVPAMATIRGRVEDAQGNPVRNADVRANGPVRDSGFSRVDDDGRFEIDGLKGGEYRVEPSLSWSSSLRKPGTTDDDPQGEVVTVEAGESAEVTLVVEARDRTISGVVVDASGGPVPDAFVRAERVSDSAAANAKNSLRQARWGGWNEQPLMTDTDGAFTVEGLSEGTYTVWAVRKGGGEGVVENVAAGSNGVSIELESTGRIEGHVRAASGSAPQRFTVNLREETTGFSRRDTFFATEGRFVMEELPPGTFFVAASSTDGSGDTEVTLAEGGVQTGVTVELQKMVRVTGKVVDLETGEPISGVSVSMERKKSGAGFSFGFRGGDQKNVTDDSGTYEIEAVPIGPASVTLFPKSMFGGESDYGWTSLNLVVEDGNPFRAPDIEMIAKRLKKGEQEGDLGFTLKASDPGTDRNDRALVVGFVRPGGPAAAAGLKVGDTIVAVDGHDVRGDKVPRYRTLTGVPVGTAVTLETEGGETVKITATKQP